MKRTFSLLKTSLILFLASTGLAFFYIGLAFNISALVIYLSLYAGVFFLFKPTLLISPLSVLHGYYFAFFVAAPLFAELHSEDAFHEEIYHLAYGMIFLTHLVAATGLYFGERSSRHPPESSENLLGLALNRGPSASLMSFLYVISTALIVFIIQSSGGFERWISAPGDAFLNRAGSGIYVVLSHFTTFLLSSLAGYAAFRTGKLRHLALFFLWLALTSPVHGSKLLIATFLAVSLTPWLFRLKLLSFSGVFLSSVMLGIFFLGLYFRNISWMTIDNALPYALNYFTALRNLVFLLEDYDPNFLQTFFLPFNKFLTPFGLSDPSLYYDMNHLLTDRYFPSAWEIRATEQWPVEADLYLNFYFLLGAPLIFIYFYVIGLIYKIAQQRPNLGVCVVAVLLTLSVVSHLRGSLYNHVDFYYYPMLLLIYFLLRRYPLPRVFLTLKRQSL